MTKEARIPKTETARQDLMAFHLNFGFRYSFDIRHSDFVIVQSQLKSAAARLTEMLPMNRCSAAQVANLPYRRLLIGEALGRRTASGLATRDTADTAVCATAEAQHGAVPEAGAPDRRGSWAQCVAKMTWRLSLKRALEGT